MTMLKDNAPYTYYHFTCENDGNVNKKFAVWANGILVEVQSEVEFKWANYLPVE